jgi:hypothetical protein
LYDRAQETLLGDFYGLLSTLNRTLARPEDRDTALAAGFNEHLSKPVDSEKLIAVLVQLMQDHPRH